MAKTVPIPPSPIMDIFLNIEKIIAQKPAIAIRLSEGQVQRFRLFFVCCFCVFLFFVFLVFLVFLAGPVNDSAGATFNWRAGTLTDTIRTFIPWPKRMLHPEFSPTILCDFSSYFQ
jgi:hypothetical protein